MTRAVRTTLALLASLAALTACASRPDRPGAPGAEAVAREQDAPLPASFGQALRSLDPATDTIYALSDAPRIALPIAQPSLGAVGLCADADIPIVWIGARAGVAQDRWIPEAGWVVLDTAADSEAAPPANAQGSWFAMLPRAAATGATLLVGDAPVRVLWAQRPASDERASPAPADRLLDEAAIDARHRWRVSMQRDARSRRAPLPPISDPALAAYADALEARARVAIGRLAGHDADLAARLTSVLSRTVTQSDSLRVPAFPPDDDALGDVFAVLLDERLAPAVAADRALHYLQGQPRAVAWIIDDAGSISGASIGVAELHGESDIVRASVSPVSSCDPPTLDPLLAHTATTIHLRCREAPSVRTIEVSAGAWRTRLDASLAPHAAAPPGLRIGPLQPTLTMRAWLLQRATPVDARWASAALLQRRAGTDRWQFYIECLDDPSVSPASPGVPDEFRLVFGPSDSPRATLVVRPDADATLLFRESALGASSASIPTVTRREEDRWTAFVDMPDDLLEPDGTLLLGAERIDPRGVRTTWPRPVFPWDDSTPRLRIDLSSWSRPVRSAD